MLCQHCCPEHLAALAALQQRLVAVEKALSNIAQPPTQPASSSKSTSSLVSQQLIDDFPPPPPPPPTVPPTQYSAWSLVVLAAAVGCVPSTQCAHKPPSPTEEPHPEPHPEPRLREEDGDFAAPPAKRVAVEMKRVNHTQQKEECPICWEPLASHRTVTLEGCGHIFHLDCIARSAAMAKAEAFTCGLCGDAVPHAALRRLKRQAWRMRQQELTLKVAVPGQTHPKPCPPGMSQLLSAGRCAKPMPMHIPSPDCLSLFHDELGTREARRQRWGDEHGLDGPMVTSPPRRTSTDGGTTMSQFDRLLGMPRNNGVPFLSFRRTQPRCARWGGLGCIRLPNSPPARQGE
eukprot:Sspe_Gene.44692::Locus_21931_Transcript_1_2_Confidence_0.500_Length_2882::g.44692::m.44692